MEIIYLILGVIAGFIIGYLVANAKKKSVETQLLLQSQQLEQTANEKDKLHEQATKTDETIQQLTAQLEQARIELAQAHTQLEAEKQQNTNEATLRKEQFEQQLKTVQEQFSNLATKILNVESGRLKDQNTEAMEHITAPLKQNIEQLQKAIQSTNQETAKSTASLSQQLREMSEQTTKINLTATRLTNVIRGGNQAQGSWGERILTEILDMQGLRVGIDYDVQQIITDERGSAVFNEDSGQKMKPDVILHYPNNEDVVIDSKMSIEAYYQYMSTEDQELKRKYADDLVKSIRNQATILAKKDYSRYIKSPRKAIDFVIMFVPNEGALQLALHTNPKIWSEAFDKQVFITSQQNLMAILKMIQIAWRQYAQTENQKRVFDMAEELLKRVGEFIKRFDKVGKTLDTLHKDYEEAYKKAYTGRQSIVQKANELKEIGVKESANQPIPAANAELEIADEA